MRKSLAAATLLSLSSTGHGAPSNGLSWRWDPQSIGLSCTLIQDLETSPVPVGVGQSVGAGDPSYSVELKVRTPRLSRNIYDGGWIVFGNGARLPADFAVYSLENRRYRIAASTEDPNYPEALAKSSAVALEHADFGRFDAKIRDSAAAVDALRTCSRNLLKQWGIDEAAYAALRSRPKPITPLREFFSSADYPVARARAGMVSNIVAKMQISADGTVISCAPHGKHRVPDFVDLVCGRLKAKARFEPARNAQGEAVAAPYVVTARFTLQ